MKRRVSQQTHMSAIYSGIGYVLEFFYSLIPNYALALLLFALLFKLVFIFGGIKQQKNAVKQAKLKPKEMAIRKKYKGRNDQTSRQKMNQEIMDMNQREGYSPFGGCLPLILQLVLVILLYAVIRNPLQYLSHFSGELIGAIEQSVVELEYMTEKELANNQILVASYFHDNFDKVLELVQTKGDFAAELSGLTADSLPNFMLFGQNLGQKPSFTSLLVLIPILNFVVSFASMKLTRKLTMQPVPGADPQTEDAMKSMQLMDFLMPLMTVWFTFITPAVLGLYWIYQSILGVAQQLILRAVYPLPQLTEEDYKAAEREIFGKNPKKKKKKNTDPNAPRKHNPNSLHYIDADDEDEPAVSPAKKGRVTAYDEDEEDAPAQEVTADEPADVPAAAKLIAPAELRDDAVPAEEAPAEEVPAAEEEPAEESNPENIENPDNTDDDTSEDKKDA